MKKYHIELTGEFYSWSNSVENARETLKANHGKPVDVLIASPGGVLANGLAFYEMFKAHGDVTVHIQGLTASAATIAAMGAKTIKMSEAAFFLIHKVMNSVVIWDYLNADEMKAEIDKLIKNIERNEMMDNVIANIYAARNNRPKEEINELLTKGEWMNAHQALEAGLIDEVIAVSDSEPSNVVDAFLNSMNLPPLPSQSVNETNFINKIKNALASIFESNNSILPSPEPANNAEPENNTNQNTNKMKKIVNLTFLLTCLSLEDLQANEDGNVTLSVEQLEAVNKRMSALEAANDILKKDKSSLSATIAERDTTIASQEAKIKEFSEAEQHVVNAEAGVYFVANRNETTNNTEHSVEELRNQGLI